MIVALENWQHSREPNPLRTGDVHLWRASLVPTPEICAALTKSEWMQANRFQHEPERERFIATRGLLRLILSKYVDGDPADLEFCTGAFGKPELSSPPTALRFNLSHSDDLLLLAVTHGREVGVDLELMRPEVPFETLADHYFDPDDAWDLRLLQPSDRAVNRSDIANLIVRFAQELTDHFAQLLPCSNQACRVVRRRVETCQFFAHTD